MKLLSSILAIALSTAALGQNTGAVFGPIVNEGHASTQYRATYDPDSDGFAQRVHYQQAINGDFMWRTVLGSRKTLDSDFDFDFVQAELFWELSDDDDAWRTGFRFDLAFRNDNRPASAGINWTNQYNFSENWSARFVALSAAQFGENANNGLILQTRASVTRKVGSCLALGVELYNFYGTTSNFGGFDEQAHQVGPVATYSFADDWSIYTGVLFGLSKSTADQELRFWLTKSF